MRSPANRSGLGNDLAATLMVAAFSMAVALGYARTFFGWPFLADMAAVVVAGHGAGLLLRRLRLPAWLAVPAMATVLAWTVLAVYYPSTFSWAMPTADTWSILREQLTMVREEFPTAVAPVDYGAGWDVLAAIGLAASVLLADVFAFRADARAETLVPGGVLFVFVGALGDERLRIASAVVVVGVGVATTVTLRAYHAEPARGDAPSPWRRWPAAIAFGVVVAVVAGVVGPRLPGADAAPIYDSSTGAGGGGSTQVISPLVDIRSRLTNRSTDELFRVRADVESYWRSSALPEFDGTTWGLPARELRPIGGPSTDRSLVDNRQRITIGALGGSLVPAAPDPFQASGPDDLRWVPETSTLVTIDGDLRAGDTIDVVSAAPQVDAARLNAATSSNPPDPIHTSVPADLPEVVGATARQVTADATTTYEAALTLQMWFQEQFEYSLEVRPGHGNSAIEAFLRDRIGYCEQFAGTYAAMLRTLGIPSRVAVGFTSGVPLGDGEFSVLGRNAHAWPEVWFDDIGWIAFEPTPGRGAPNAQSYTQLDPQQDTSAVADDIQTRAVLGPPITVGDAAPTEAGPGLEIPDFSEDTAGDTPTTAAPANDHDGAGSGQWLWLIGLAVLGAAIAAPSMIRDDPPPAHHAVGRPTTGRRLATRDGRGVRCRRAASSVGHPVGGRSAHRTPSAVGQPADGVTRRSRDRGDLPGRRDRRIRRRRRLRREHRQRLPQLGEADRSGCNGIARLAGTDPAPLHRLAVTVGVGGAESAGGVVVDVGSTPTEPCGDRQLAESFTSEQAQFGFEQDRHDQHQDEPAEGHHETDGEPPDRDHETEHEAHDQGDRATARHAVPALGERRVLFELLLDLTQDALLILGERHEAIIARFGSILNAVAGPFCAH
jgi:transglutaminase-like putative cysteine protease